MRYFGYVTSRPFGPIFMPVPAQNSALREFTLRQRGDFVLPPLESCFANCYHYLFDLMLRIPAGSNLVMYSVLMLPSDEKLKKVLDIQMAKSLTICFVLENLITNESDAIARAVSVYRLKNLSADGSLLTRRLAEYGRDRESDVAI